ncbi:MAG: HEPN domain-containing protein [Candidatus Aenigmarchaeota archaeon]|nr:HEPN domain-containing protein [Candidatus Aenigmarchaeota archaeon]
MNKLKWCASKRGGLKLVDPNPNLAEAYIKKAEEALESMRINVSRDWKISTAYYAVYFSLYSLMMKLGVKCEIHSCTIEFTKQFLKEYFSEGEIDFVRDSLKARIDAQYYIDRTVRDALFEKMIDSAPGFLVKCKSLHVRLNEKKVAEIRKKFLEKVGK